MKEIGKLELDVVSLANEFELGEGDNMINGKI